MRQGWMAQRLLRALLLAGGSTNHCFERHPASLEIDGHWAEGAAHPHKRYAKMRFMTMARALRNQDAHGLEQLRRHWGEFGEVVREGADGYELIEPERFEGDLAEALRSGTAQRARRSGREARRGEEGARSVAKRARAGSMRTASLWRARRPMLRRSGVRVVSETTAGATEVVRQPGDMAAAIKDHWMPVFRADGEAQPGLQDEVAKWATPRDLSRIVPMRRKDVQEVLGRARRTAPGLDGIPYAMWRQAGAGGADAIDADRFC